MDKQTVNSYTFVMFLVLKHALKQSVYQAVLHYVVIKSVYSKKHHIPYLLCG